MADLAVHDRPIYAFTITEMRRLPKQLVLVGVHRRAGLTAVEASAAHAGG
jgi:hypothetical protein